MKKQRGLHGSTTFLADRKRREKNKKSTKKSK